MHQEKKYYIWQILWFSCTINVCRIRFQEITIGVEGFLRKSSFSHFSSWENDSGQKWFLKPYFPLIGDTFVFRSGLRFSFWALEVPEPRVRKRHLHFQNWLSTPYNIPPSPPIYCLHLWTSFIQKFRKNQYHRLIVLSESFLSSYSSRERDVSMEVCA